MGSLLATLALETIGTQEYTFSPAQFVARVEASYGVDAAADVAEHLR